MSTVIGRASKATTLSNAAVLDEERAEYLSSPTKLEDFATGAADSISKSAQYLRNNDTKAMLVDVEALVRSHPGPFLLIAGVLGFFAGRALKARD